MGRASEGAKQATKTNQNRLTKSCSNSLPAGPLGKKVAHGLGARPGSRLVQVVWCEGVQGGRLDEFHARSSRFRLSAVATEIAFSLPATSPNRPRPSLGAPQTLPNKSTITPIPSEFISFEHFHARPPLQFSPCRIELVWLQNPPESSQVLPPPPKRKNLNARRTTQCMRIDSYACAVF